MPLMVADMRDTLREQIQVVDPSSLLPHHHRGALLIAPPEADLLDIAVTIATDDAESLAALIAQKNVYKPSLGELADWCVDQEMRVQFIILQPYVLAQRILQVDKSLS